MLSWCPHVIFISHLDCFRSTSSAELNHLVTACFFSIRCPPACLAPLSELQILPTFPWDPYDLFTDTMISFMAFLIPLLALVHLASSTPAVAPRYFPQGTISSPANGTAIAPGAAFDFKYNTRGDYCMSSFNFTVWLATSPPNGGFGPETNLLTGVYLGRFSEENYPGKRSFLSMAYIELSPYSYSKSVPQEPCPGAVGYAQLLGFCGRLRHW
jgi:hypothetical protein